MCAFTLHYFLVVNQGLSHGTTIGERRAVCHSNKAIINEKETCVWSFFFFFDSRQQFDAHIEFFFSWVTPPPFGEFIIQSAVPDVLQEDVA